MTILSDLRDHGGKSEIVLIRDSRTLYVNPADDLQISISLDEETYKPGEKANVQFQITNKEGDGTPAALGISIVDESVFALQEIHPGLEKVYFTLEKEIMKPRYEIHGYDLEVDYHQADEGRTSRAYSISFASGDLLGRNGRVVYQPYQFALHAAIERNGRKTGMIRIKSLSYEGRGRFRAEVEIR